MIAATVERITIGIRAQSGNSRKNGLDAGGRVGEDQRALAEVVEDQRGEDEREPGAADRGRAEVAHVGVQRLGAGDGEHDAAERDERLVAVVEEELGAVVRRQRAEDLGVLERPHEPGEREHREPDDHDRPEEPADRAGPEALDGEQPGQHDQRDRDDELLEALVDDLEALDRRQHRDRGRDHAVAVEQRGAEDAEQDERDLRAAAAQVRALDQRDQGHDPALAVVVGAHDERHVLDRDDHRDRPEDQRDDAEDGCSRPGSRPCSGAKTVRSV